MLRIITRESDDSVELDLAGNLRGAWVLELEETYADVKARLAGRPLYLNVADLTGTDASGRYLVRLMRNEGAQLSNVTPILASLLASGGNTETQEVAAS